MRLAGLSAVRPTSSTAVLLFVAVFPANLVLTFIVNYSLQLNIKKKNRQKSLLRFDNVFPASLGNEKSK